MSFWSSNVKQQRSGEDIVSVKRKGELYYFAVYDGHGRSFNLDENHVATYCDKYLAERVFAELENNFKPDLAKVFNEFNYEMMLKNLKAGCCATVIVLDYDKRLIYSINLGDSKTFLIKNGMVTFETIDHHPNLARERFRIENYGGWVRNNRVKGRLAVSRAFGDFEYGALVSSTPDIEIFPFEDLDILMSSDGIFENCTVISVLTDFQIMQSHGDKNIANSLVEKLYPTTTDDCSVIHIHLVHKEE